MFLFLDQFPIELFDIIFSYLWGHEILYSFGNISVYIDSILSSYNNYLINLESIRKSDFDLICRYVRPEQVISLILSDKIDTPNQSQLFQSFFSIKQFVNLRALKFIELDDDGESFFSDLYKVKDLVSFEIDVKIKLPLIKISPSVERVVINIQLGVHFNIDPSISMIRLEQLSHLSLSNCSSMYLHDIFCQAVRLTSLKVSLVFCSPIEIQIFARFHEEQTPIPPLVSLSLSIVGRITSYGAEREFLDAYRWEVFLSEHLPKLLIFNFKFSSQNIDQNVIDQYRRPFWVDKHWYVACDQSPSCLFTVPYFAPSLINTSFGPMSLNLTTLPIEQHVIFFDCVTDLIFNSDGCKFPYRYNYVKKLILDDPSINDTILDLSKVQSFIVNTSKWSFYKIMKFIKKSMPSVNYLSFNCKHPSVRYQHFPNISLKQVKILCLPQYGIFEGNDPFNWSQLFPSIERLIVSINSKNQIKFLINQFNNMISGYFFIHSYHIDSNKQIKITRQWLEKNIDRFKGKNTNNFICQIDDRYLFSLRLWIGENDQQLQMVRDRHWWQQCLPWNFTK